MTDLQATLELLNKIGLNFHKTVLYDENNQICGESIWLEKIIGHIEFDKDGNFKNIVRY